MAGVVRLDWDSLEHSCRESKRLLVERLLFLVPKRESEELRKIFAQSASLSFARSSAVLTPYSVVYYPSGRGGSMFSSNHLELWEYMRCMPEWRHHPEFFTAERSALRSHHNQAQVPGHPAQSMAPIASVKLSRTHGRTSITNSTKS